MPEDPAKYLGLGAASTRCRRVPRGKGLKVCITKPKTPGPQVSQADDVYQLLKRQGASLPTESFYSVLVNVRNEVIGIEEIARGTLTGVDVHPRDVFQGALLANAAAVIVAHNHPSGDTAPSADDLALTQRLKKSGELLGVPVLDHIVLGDKGFTSIASLGVSLDADDEELSRLFESEDYE